MIQLVDAVDDVRQYALDGSKTDLAARAALRDFEHGALGLIDHLARFAAFRIQAVLTI